MGMDFSRILGIVRAMPWANELSDEAVLRAAEAAFAEVKFKPSETPKIIRIAGQSGSGKTTQLLPAVLASINADDYITVAVRDFVKFYPNAEKFDPKEVREKTNGFALAVLAVVLLKLIYARANIVLDLTLLTTEFEAEVLTALKHNGYERVYQIMAVPRSTSDKHIEKRERETGRSVSLVSKEFFFNVLEPATSFLAENDPKSSVSLWGAFKPEPLYSGEIELAPKFLSLGRAEILPQKHTEKELLKFKKKFLGNL
ncbi:MAG: zeta toxin family protein [Christensenellaceae bacterium]|jgi:energy-coupling factor transporter ATP-binding protein EcfA2|nr:zeta toxin family protein [Christensenellaceae bacterium]